MVRPKVGRLKRAAEVAAKLEGGGNGVTGGGGYETNEWQSLAEKSKASGEGKASGCSTAKSGGYEGQADLPWGSDKVHPDGNWQAEDYGGFDRAKWWTPVEGMPMGCGGYDEFGKFDGQDEGQQTGQANRHGGYGLLGNKLGK